MLHSATHCVRDRFKIKQNLDYGFRVISRLDNGAWRAFCESVEPERFDGKVVYANLKVARLVDVNFSLFLTRLSTSFSLSPEKNNSPFVCVQ